MENLSDQSLDDLKKLGKILNQLQEKSNESGKTIEEINEDLMNKLFRMKQTISQLRTLENEITKAQLDVNESTSNLLDYRKDFYKEFKKAYNLKSIKESDVQKILLKKVEEAKKKITDFRNSQQYKDYLDEIAKLEESLTYANSDIYNATNGGKATNAQIDALIIKRDAIQKQIETKKDELKDFESNDKDVIEARKQMSLAEDFEKKYQKFMELKKISKKDLITLQELENKKQLEGYTKLDEYSQKFEERTKTFKKGLGEMGSGFKTMGSALKSALDPWNKANKEAFAYAKSIGASKKTTEQLLRTTLSWAAKNNIGLLFNKTTDELIKMQSKYSEILGRNTQLTGEQKKDMLAMAAVVGDDNTLKVAEGFDNFGMGMTDTADFIYKTYKNAAKYGISASKLTTTIADNIKMAQNYTFKDGLKGLESMAKKAVELKTDMSLVSAMADKVSTVEGAINVGANLQVLGGSYTMASDPLSMMREGLMDMEGLFDRVVGMIRGKAYYDESMGQIDMGAFDKQMIKQMAQVTGVDYNKAMDVAYRQASLDEINSQIGLSEGLAGNEKSDLRNLVANMATLKGGRAVVSIDGKDVDVRNIGDKDRSKLEQMQKTDSQNMQDMAVRLRSMDDLLSGSIKEKANEQANMTKHLGELTTKILGNVVMMNRLMQMSAMGSLIGNATSFVGGGFNAANGTIRSAKGLRNILTMKPHTIAKRNAVPEKYMTYITQKSKNKGGRMAVITESGKKHYAEDAERYVNKQKALAKEVRFRSFASKAARGTLGGLASGAMTFGTTLADGSFNSDRGGATGRIAGSAIGGAIGAAIVPFAPTLGAMIGSVAGEAIAKGVQKGVDKANDKIRNGIAESFEANGEMALAKLFTGENALQGRYNRRQLESLKNAISDKNLQDGEVNKATVRKLRENGDLERLRNSGVGVSDYMAGGGFPEYSVKSEGNMTQIGGMVKGNSHKQGGKLVLVEGNEYVVKAKSLEKGDNLDIVRSINENGTIFVKNAEGISSEKYSFKERPTSQAVKVGKISSAPIGDSISKTSGNGRIEHVFNLNFGGNIKISGIDITNELRNNQTFKRQLANMVAKEMNIMTNGSYNKNDFLAKFD